jgi:hypothetical protein
MMLNMTDMTEQPQAAAQPLELTGMWGLPVEMMICERCDWRFILPQGGREMHCPHCFQAKLERVEPNSDDLAYVRAPEMFLPFTATGERITQTIRDFGKGGWFAPGDLKPQNLLGRLQRVYMPMWLVDGAVQATWQAEAGFNYEVVSHQDQYSDSQGGWRSQEIKETRIRWEARLGRLDRTYQNLAAPALEAHAWLMQRLGGFDLPKAQPYTPAVLQQAFVRLPDRDNQDAWPDAAAAFQSAATAECAQAARADHNRNFRWAPEYRQLNWTLLLLPVYVTYYLDDDRQPQVALVHGQTGALSGTRRASMKRARNWALGILAAALAVFLLSAAIGGVGVFFPPALAIAAVGVPAAAVVGLCAIIPLGIAWNVNRKK